MRREIVAKAILKRVNKTYEQIIRVNDSVSEKVLGCWMLQPFLQVSENGENVGMEGSYFVNAWVGIENLTTTKCVIEKQMFKDAFPRPSVNESVDEVKSYYSKKPSCEKAWVENGDLCFRVQYSIVIEWIGDTKMYVEVVEDEIDEVVDVAINEEYI